MRHTKWFSGAQCNYAQQVFRHVVSGQAGHAAGMAAVVSSDDSGQISELSRPELRRQVASLALHLREHDLLPGDRVAA